MADFLYYEINLSITSGKKCIYQILFANWYCKRLQYYNSKQMIDESKALKRPGGVDEATFEILF